MCTLIQSGPQLLNASAMRRVCALLSVVFSLGVAQAGDVSVFAVAHADDWQLFMNPAAFHATQGATNRVVFIVATAGDSGERARVKEGLMPYYRAREAASLRAIRYMVDAQGGPGGPRQERTTVTLNGHDLERYAYFNCVSYFLRLPDGSADGGGYRRNRFESLKNFYFKNINIMTAVDGRNVYRGWKDFTSTLSAIVKREAAEAQTLHFHVFDTDEELNPGDHSDHRCTSLAMQAVAEEHAVTSLLFHGGYATGERARNVRGHDYQIDVGAWAVTAASIADYGYPSPWGTEHNAWVGKSYVRIKRMPEDVE